MFSPRYSRIVETEAPKTIAEKDVSCSGQFHLAARLFDSVADPTHTPAKSDQLAKTVLTVTKRNPG
jgi:hypothetical protein